MSEKGVWAVITLVSPVDELEQEAKYISELNGLIGAHVECGYVLWLFDSENSARVAKNKVLSKGIKCGDTICPVHIDEKYMEGGK